MILVLMIISSFLRQFDLDQPLCNHKEKKIWAFHEKKRD